MKTKRVKAVIQFRRGKLADWERINPILRLGEPSFVVDTGGIKIGDGVTPWNDLQYQSGSEIVEKSVISRDTIADFPSVGNENLIYKANKEGILYQWNEEKLAYEQLNSFNNITIINGGEARV